MWNECCELGGEFICEFDGRFFLIVETGEWDTYNDCFREETVEINYCPFCGSKLSKGDFE